MSTLVGVDVGTTRVKAVAFGLDGRPQGERERPTPWRHVDGGSEADAVDLADVVRTVVAEVATDRVLGVGVTGMAEAGVLLDREGRPTAPVLAWHDDRADVDQVADRIGVEAFQRTVGMHLDSKPSLPKIVWLRHRTTAARDAVRFASVPEWGVRALGGDAVSELSLASRTGLLDLAAKRPWDGATDLVGTSMLSELVLAGTPCGRVGDQLPEGAKGAVLTVAGHDHQAAAFAAGAARTGVLLDSVGTAEALLRCVAPLDAVTVAALTARDVSCGWGVVPGRYTVLKGVRTGLLLERLADLLGAHDRAARHELGAQARDVDPPDGFALRDEELGPLVDRLPPANAWAVAVRDLAARSADAVDAIETVLGRHDHAVVVGGWLRNPAVGAAKARQFPAYRTVPWDEPGAAGAALLAGIAAGVLDRPRPDEAPRWQ